MPWKSSFTQTTSGTFPTRYVQNARDNRLVLRYHVTTNIYLANYKAKATYLVHDREKVFADATLNHAHERSKDNVEK